MKDIKSFIIGFLSCTCLFLFMGHTSDYPQYPFAEHKHTIEEVHNLLSEMKKQIEHLKVTQDVYFPSISKEVEQMSKYGVYCK